MPQSIYYLAIHLNTPLCLLQLSLQHEKTTLKLLSHSGFFHATPRSILIFQTNLKNFFLTVHSRFIYRHTTPVPHYHRVRLAQASTFFLIHLLHLKLFFLAPHDPIFYSFLHPPFYSNRSSHLSVPKRDFTRDAFIKS